MEETALRKIEHRITSYPAQARRDIVRLMRDVRRRRREIEAGKKPRLRSSLYDSLTGLPNGAACGIRFAVARARAGRCKTTVAVIFVDLTTVTEHDNCNEVRASSHAATLMPVAQCLLSTVRITDTVAHIGGLRFAIILEDLICTNDAKRVTSQLQDILSKRIALGKIQGIADMHVQVQFYSGSGKARIVKELICGSGWTDCVMRRAPASHAKSPTRTSNKLSR